MYPSADLCRIQEALQRRRAESAPLGNVSTIAHNAAAAWGAEARYAEGRELRQPQLRAVLVDQIGTEPLACDQLDLASSENPDRGRAAAAILPHPL